MSSTAYNFKIDKNLVYKSAKGMGFSCALEDGILKFYPKDAAERSRMQDWIDGNVHFSWGFPYRKDGGFP